MKGPAPASPAAIGTAASMALLAFVSPGRSHAEVTNVPCVADTFIVARNPDGNAGAQMDLAAGRDGEKFGGDGRRRALFLFNLAGIPTDAIVTSAVFRLDVIRQASADVDSTFSLHRLVTAWGEGGGTGSSGSPAAPGEATWNSRLHGVSPWGAAGGDFSAIASAAAFVSSSGAYAWTGTGLVADVQTWVRTPAHNHGCLLKDSESTPYTARRLGSREGGTPAVLEVGYVVVPPPPVAILATAVSNDVRLKWSSDPRQRYDVEYRRSLTDTSGWHVAESDIPASTDRTNLWQDAPYLASPAYSVNSSLVFRLKVLDAAPPALPIDFDVIASNLTSPTVLTHAGDGSGRLFVAEQTGRILIVTSNRTVLPAPFLDLTAKMTNLSVFGAGGHTKRGLNPFYDERGLLGLAFHPAYAQNGRFFVYYSSPKTAPGVDHEGILEAYTVSTTNVNTADAASGQVILRVDEPEFNHNGGCLAFGPDDGFLYVSLGDGGGAGDAHGAFGNGQNTNNLLGSILRIDVDGAPPYSIPPDNPFVGVPGADEIYAYGFRNPWKLSFDRGGSHDLLVADVGQALWEEVDRVIKGGNYGWRILEGRHAYDPAAAMAAGVAIPSLLAPVHEYRHGPLGISIIGGFVYRGTRYPELDGCYVFGDFSTAFGAPDGALYYLSQTRPGIWQRFSFETPGGTRLGRYVKGIGEDEAGELYLLSSTNLGPSGVSADIRLLRRP